MSNMFDTVEERKTYLATKIARDRELLALGSDIIAVAKELDGKVYNKRFDEALRQRTGFFFRSEITGYGSFTITISSPKSYQMSCVFSIPVNKGFTLTDSGKYRIKAEGIVPEIEKQMQERNKTEDELEEALKSGQIEKAREEFTEITKELREFKQKYSSIILGVAGCSFSLRPIGAEFADYDFYV